MDKNSFRTLCIKRLKKADNIRKRKKDTMILSRLYTEIKKTGAKSVALYLPMGMEVNLYPLINQLRKERYDIYVPFMEDKSFRLVRYRLPLRRKKFGIKEPNNSKQYRNKKIDIIVVPIIGIDSLHKRIGFGKGMYDRFFEKEHANIKKVIFVARELCYINKVVSNQYDISGDMIITS